MASRSRPSITVKLSSGVDVMVAAMTMGIIWKGKIELTDQEKARK
jgi:hypothetical protein